MANKCTLCVVVLALIFALCEQANAQGNDTTFPVVASGAPCDPDDTFPTSSEALCRTACANRATCMAYWWWGNSCRVCPKCYFFAVDTTLPPASTHARQIPDQSCLPEPPGRFPFLASSDLVVCGHRNSMPRARDVDAQPT